MKVLVTAGPTREAIDPVRFVSNRSSGKMGYAVAAAARRTKHAVVLVSGPVAIAPPQGVDVVRVTTAAEMLAAVRKRVRGCDLLVMAAAVADFRVADVAQGKLTKEDGGIPALALVENPDILKGLCELRREGQTIVGFAAETGTGDELLERGRRKRRRKGVDLLAVNEVGWTKGFEAADNHLIVLDRTDEVVADAAGSKRAVADALLDAVVSYRSGQSSSGISS